MIQNLAQEFDTVFKDRGGIINFPPNDVIYSVLKPPLEEAMDTIESIRRTKNNLPKVYLNYIDNDSLNAVAATYNGNYFIGINIGTVFLLQQLFDRMLSSPNILIDYGNPKAETPTKKIFNAQITNFITYSNAKEPDEDIVPVDHFRRYISSMLLSKALTFLFMHEYAHIIFGHLDFIINKTSTLSYSENDEALEINSMVSQTLEFDADSFAINVSLQQARNQLGQSSQQNISPMLKNIWGDLEKNINMTIYAVYSMFKLIGNSKIDLGIIRTHKHPPTPLRQMALNATMVTIFMAKGYDNWEKIATSNTQMLGEVEKAFSEISHQELDLSFFHIATHPEAQEHLNRIAANWKNVRPLLEPFATGNLAPINKI